MFMPSESEVYNRLKGGVLVRVLKFVAVPLKLPTEVFTVVMYVPPPYTIITKNTLLLQCVPVTFWCDDLYLSILFRADTVVANAMTKKVNEQDTKTFPKCYVGRNGKRN